uniref:60S ribosomal export protein NMD3 n=1 Tax=Ananas comosus var. bracteatus TaxID=296719 RepID=A0A6V7PMD3_ANACO|nr:unnamed protein product [Ananas comosus var. bracteatus]
MAATSREWPTSSAPSPAASTPASADPATIPSSSSTAPCRPSRKPPTTPPTSASSSAPSATASTAPLYLHCLLRAPRFDQAFTEAVRLRGPLSRRARLVHAEFLFTEHHPKRLLLRLRVQREVDAARGAILEQPHVVEFVVHNRLCKGCSRA